TDLKLLVKAQKPGKVRRVKTGLFAPANVVLASLCLLPLTIRPATVADDKPGVGLKLMAEGFTSPTTLIQLDDDSGRLLVADQIGIIHLLTQDGAKAEPPF